LGAKTKKMKEIEIEVFATGRTLRTIVSKSKLAGSKLVRTMVVYADGTVEVGFCRV